MAEHWCKSNSWNVYQETSSSMDGSGSKSSGQINRQVAAARAQWGEVWSKLLLGWFSPAHLLKALYRTPTGGTFIHKPKMVVSKCQWTRGCAEEWGFHEAQLQACHTKDHGQSYLRNEWLDQVCISEVLVGKGCGISSREGNMVIASKTTRRLTLTYNPLKFLVAVYIIDILA